jgi:hypothetical protein
MLNWRRDPDYERRKMLYEQRMNRIEKEIEQLRQENARLARLNAWDQALDACIKRLCFPPDSNLTLPTPTEPDSRGSSP